MKFIILIALLLIITTEEIICKEKLFQRLDSAVKINDSFEIQKYLHWIFYSKSDIPNTDNWLEVAKIFLKYDRCLASFICYKRISENLLNTDEEELKDEGWGKVYEFCENNFDSIPLNSCNLLRLMPYYEVKDRDFFEFLTFSSYPINQQNAYNLIKGVFDKRQVLNFIPQNSEEDYAKLDIIPNTVPPDIDLNELMRNVEYPPEAKAAGFEGRIVIMVMIDIDGSILYHFTKNGGNEILIEAGLKAIKKTKIIPGTVYNEPYPMLLGVPINFILR